MFMSKVSIHLSWCGYPTTIKKNVSLNINIRQKILNGKKKIIKLNINIKVKF